MLFMKMADSVVRDHRSELLGSLRYGEKRSLIGSDVVMHRDVKM